MLIISAKQAILPGHADPVAATLEISSEAGKILQIHESAKTRQDYSDVDDSQFIQLEDDQILLPGLVDAHVHLNSPGRDAWEGFETGTQAAASGGITTLIDMPLNSIPSTTTVANLKAKTDAATGKCHIDVGFWGGVVPGNQDDLLPLIEAGVKGFKCFLCDSGVDEFPMVQEDDLIKAMEKLKDSESLLLFHAELGDRVDNPDLDIRRYSTFLKSSPNAMEEDAISLVARLSAAYPKLRTHIVHLSASSALPILEEAREKQKLPLSVETCIHYLTLSAEDVPEGRTDFKCCPPIRDNSNREELWKALQEGKIDFVVSDHSPCVAELKRLPTGDFMSAWGGIGGLGLGLPLMYTEACKRGIKLSELLQWMASKPAKQVGLEKQKGSLVVGKDADFVIFNANKKYTLRTEDLAFKNKVSPYTGMELIGKVERTYLRGELVFDASASSAFLEKPRGQLLL